MKTTEHNPTSISPMQKKSETSFFDHHSEQEQPFFLPNKAVGNDTFFSPRPFSNGSIIQPKLTVGQPNDVYEQEADSVADKVVQRLSKSSTAIDPSMPDDNSDISIQRKCAACEVAEKNVQRKPTNTEGVASSDIEAQLNSSKGGGSPLSNETRTALESTMGADFSNVRVHTGSNAVQMSQDLNAQAFTHGADVYFNSGKYNPSDRDGERLLAHELVHTVQQSEMVNKKIQRFHLPRAGHAIDERPNIAPTFNDLMTVITEIATASTIPGSAGFLSTGEVNMNNFVLFAGGSPATAQMDAIFGTRSTPTVPNMLRYRYLFTCRCGLIDMRHFIQLMYISHFAASMSLPPDQANSSATRRGREHELSSESESRFGPEDTPSNALGAFTGTQLAGYPQPTALIGTIQTILTRCNPIDFATLSVSSQDQVAHYYGDLIADPSPKTAGDLIPAHQNQTAVAAIIDIPECSGRERSFPFELDSSTDSDRRTISGFAFDSGSAGLTSDSEIRSFVYTQRDEIIRDLQATEKARLVARLFSGWISDEDIDAFERIYNLSSTTDKAVIRAVITTSDFMNLGQRTRVRAIIGEV